MDIDLGIEKRDLREEFTFNQSGPNLGSAQSSMADMRIATGPWD